ncbi:bifunctional metallophosphatase/5'-nucleotidase [Terrilactibacillus laevilacticus]|uniref:bifunctional metallophosphatase/5'-nucleotidase n=1 Tax=Terrilactibacillus laevilacticus TaxID=1380157 RepID=UPI001146337A|nr:bifunctional UDP-sugar hydrolase/5'-nucleotidase [Terrilactibacillus laevilacticus]
MKKLHLFHTNDVHSHFEHWASFITYIKNQREKLKNNGEPSLLFDLGDHMDRVNPLTEGTMGSGNVKLLNQAGYDFITIGNNEGITFTKDILDHLYDHRHFQVVLANLYDKEGNRPHWCTPFVICEIEGITLGITAATARFSDFYSPLGWDIRDPFSEVEPIIKNLREQADVVVLMSHIGLPFDKMISEKLPDIDVILGSHTHHFLHNGLEIGSTLITQTGKFGQFAGHVTLEIEESTKTIVNKEAYLIPLDQDEDIETKYLIHELSQKGMETLQEVITVMPGPLSVDWYGKSELPCLLAESLREWCHADMSIINAGLILKGLEPGVVTKEMIHRICPHPINPCNVQLTGEDLLTIINRGRDKEFQTFELKGFGFRGKVVGALIFSGLSYNEREGSIHEEDVMVNNQPLNRYASYKVATIDMFTFGALLPPIAKAKQNFFIPETLRDLLGWKLKTYFK